MFISEAESTFDREQPRPASLIARQGLAFQRKVFKVLLTTLSSDGFSLHHDSWFRYRNGDDVDRYCATDILIIDHEEGFIAVGEVKLSWVPTALPKLRDLYCPVVAKAFDMPTKP